jgi:GntR family transcriptional regulator, transcriptional repressor for pyruvate dehydrogenase complex
MSEYRIERPPRLHELVAQRMQQFVFSGQWAMGSRLPAERELCSQFGVSRTVVREALKVLVARGLLAESVGKGLTVSQSVSEPLRSFVDLFLAKEASEGQVHLFEVRSVLEVEIAGLAAERAMPEEAHALQRIHAELCRLAQKPGLWDEGDVAEFEKVDLQFHLTLAKCTRNELFVILLGALSDALITAWASTVQREEVRKHAIQMHEKILQAILSGDARAARQATRDSLHCFLEDAVRMAEATQATSS